MVEWLRWLGEPPVCGNLRMLSCKIGEWNHVKSSTSGHFGAILSMVNVDPICCFSSFEVRKTTYPFGLFFRAFKKATQGDLVPTSFCGHSEWGFQSPSAHQLPRQKIPHLSMRISHEKTSISSILLDFHQKIAHKMLQCCVSTWESQFENMWKHGKVTNSMCFSLLLKQNGEKNLVRKHQNHGLSHGFPIFSMVFPWFFPWHVQLIRICPRTASGKTPPRATQLLWGHPFSQLWEIQKIRKAMGNP